MKCRRTRLKSEVIYSGNILIVERTHDKKKEEVKPKLSGEKNVSCEFLCVFLANIFSSLLIIQLHVILNNLIYSPK